MRITVLSPCRESSIPRVTSSQYKPALALRTRKPHSGACSRSAARTLLCPPGFGGALYEDAEIGDIVWAFQLLPHQGRQDAAARTSPGRYRPRVRPQQTIKGRALREDRREGGKHRYPLGNDDKIEN